LKTDGLVKSQKAPVIVIPVKLVLDLIGNGNPGNSTAYGLPLPDQVEDKLRGSDGLGDFLRFCQN